MSSRILDACIVRAHRLSFGGRRYHPYFAATDAGTVAIVAFSAWFARARPGVGFWRFVLAFALMQLGYVGFRAVKRRLFGITSRSFLQDSVLFILPAFAAASVAVGNDLSASLDLAGLDLALGAAFIRVGCFVGGCCYGRAWKGGVLYPAALLTPVRGCRTYDPGDVPDGRVIPIQLAEAAFNAASFACLLVLAANDRARGLILPLYLLGYGAWRFAADFLRTSSARPRRAGLSEAQWVSLVVVAVMAAVVLRFR